MVGGTSTGALLPGEANLIDIIEYFKTVTTHLLLSRVEICQNSFSRRALFHLRQLQRLEDQLFCLPLRFGQPLNQSTKATVLINMNRKDGGHFLSWLLLVSSQQSDLKFRDVFCSLLEKVRFSASREYRSWCGDICTRIILCSI